MYKSGVLKILLFSVVITFLYSCNKEPHTPDNFDYLLSYEKVNTLEKVFITNMYSTIGNSTPEILNLKDSVKTAVEVYKVIYKTTYKGEPIEASGLINVPKNSGVYPILSFQNGTNTSNANAPSENAGSINFLLWESLAASGFILLIPDYIGFGSSSQIVHPYYQKETSNQAVIDFIYAAREFIANYDGDATYSTEYFLAGYSQGGWATLAALEEIENNPDININVVATSAGAGAYDLLEVSNQILLQDTFPGPLYLPYYIYSHNTYGSLTEPLDLFFKEPYTSRIPQLFDGSYTNSQVNNQLTDTLALLLQPQFIQGFAQDDEFAPLRNNLERNSISPWYVKSKIRFYHGSADIIVPPEQSANIYQAFSNLSNNLPVEHFELPELTHETGILPWGSATISWFNQLKSTDY